jgi:hypothetical protein
VQPRSNEAIGAWLCWNIHPVYSSFLLLPATAFNRLLNLNVVSNSRVVFHSPPPYFAARALNCVAGLALRVAEFGVVRAQRAALVCAGLVEVRQPQVWQWAGTRHVLNPMVEIT